MDVLVHRVLRFDRFVLDLSNCCLRVDGGTIDLRPKTFAVLQQLAENPGRLVTRETFSRVVWRDVVVGDDSLSQCIRELRQVLGDTDHRLIKTVSRRGYLLNATPVEVPSMPDVSPVARDIAAPAIVAAVHAPKAAASPRWRFRAAIAVALSLAFAVGLLLSTPFSSVYDRFARVLYLFKPPAENLMSAEDGKRVEALAAAKELPLPAFHIEAPARDVPDNVRKFVGVWVSDSGWVNSQRQLMMIVTKVRRDGTASGYWINGPAKPHSRIPGSAFSGSFVGHVSGDTLRYDGSTGMHLASLTGDGRIEFKLVFQDGTSGLVMLGPVWTLQKREKAAAMSSASTTKE